MISSSLLSARRLALLAVVFVIGVACAKVDREYDDSAYAGAGGTDDSGGNGGRGGNGGTSGSGTAGKPSGGEGGEAGSGAAGEAGSAGESSAGAAGAPADLATLTVALAGDGSGTVKSLPAGIDCGTTCSTAVDPGSSIQLTATPAAASVFVGWSGGGCTGTGKCTTTVSASDTVTATFAHSTYELTVVKSGAGVGTVTSTPAGINCGADCAEDVNYGAVVTLTATPTTGTVFAGWTGGGCTGTGACAVTMTAAATVTASFTCSSGTLTIPYSGAITSFAIPTCVTSLTIDAYGAQGGNAGTYTGGYGARIKGTFAVTGGSTLKVLVGGKGQDSVDTSQQEGGSGGGGTFVTTSANSPLAVAGGGGGASLAAPAGNGLGGAITTAGLAGAGGAEAGGINGNGGTSCSWAGWHGGSGGGGLLSNGVNVTGGISASYGSPNLPGSAFVNGGAGGVAGTCGTPAITGCNPGARNGGFGGGGAAGFTGGGGGGYSGGGAGLGGGTTTATWAGGSGGSYNSGTAQTNAANTRVGNGTVIFTW